MIQFYAERVGRYGCYFLSILKLAEMAADITEGIDALRAYKKCLDLDLIEDDCYVRKPADIIFLYTGQEYEVFHAPADYETPMGQLEIVRYEWPRTMETLSHFAVGDGMGGVGWDPLGSSQTVQYGRLVSKRIFRRIA